MQYRFKYNTNYGSVVGLKRFKHNPILIPDASNFWESKAVFNCAATNHDGKVHMLYRAIGEYEHYISRLGYAVSEDGIHFKRFDEPVMEPTVRYELGGCEDPRICIIDNKIYITYVVLSFPQREKGIARTALASTEDFLDYNKIGIITPHDVDDKDVVIFPEKIEGKYIMMHRPNWVGEKYGVAKPSMWLAYSDNLHDWGGDKVLLEPMEKWEERKIGVGPPPIKTKDGWLVLYHGVDTDFVYRAGAVLLDLHDPLNVIAKTRKPILEPKEPYEKVGDVPNVVFPTGTAMIDNKLYVYYGAADKVIAVAYGEIDELLDTMDEI